MSAKKKDLAAAEVALPEFDYSGLSQQTVAILQSAEAMFRHGQRVAQAGIWYMVDAVCMAHEELMAKSDQRTLDSDAVHKVDVISKQVEMFGESPLLTNMRTQNRGVEAFSNWCAHMGVSRSTAYKLLQVGSLYDGSTPRQQELLQNLAPSLLYVASRPDAPEELVDEVKSGEITTHKEFQTRLKELEARAQYAEEEAQKGRRENARLKETLQGRTDHLNAVEAENVALKGRLEGPKPLPAVPCRCCAYRDRHCWGLDCDSVLEDILKTAPLAGCTAGVYRKED